MTGWFVRRHQMMLLTRNASIHVLEILTGKWVNSPTMNESRRGVELQIGPRVRMCRDPLVLGEGISSAKPYGDRTDNEPKR